MGHFFEEEVGADWFEEPISCEDLEGHVRLADKLEIAIAAGESLYSRKEFNSYLQRGALDIVQPDITRVGGLTAFLKISTLTEQHHRPLGPHLFPELAVHLACGLPEVRIIEYMPWLYPIFVDPPAIVKGRLVPPQRPGIGLEIRPDAVEKYRVEV
jgi:L-alanine-DL-glutamate epimerase-like enolase superfamily enzyme